jgi:hypothetical protein
MSPVPLAPNPIDVLLFDHVKLVPVPLKFAPLTNVPLQTVWFPGTETLGVGLTVIVKLWEDPLHDTLLFVYTGVTTKFPVEGVLPLFVPVKEAMLPLPLEPILEPIVVLSFVQP